MTNGIERWLCKLDRYVNWVGLISPDQTDKMLFFVNIINNCEKFTHNAAVTVSKIDCD